MFFKQKAAPVSWIAVFLGNPGARFENTRHNTGYMAAEAVEMRAGVKINRFKFNSLTALATIGSQRLLLMKPQTYMNLSGGAVRQAMKFYKVPISNLVTISDDAALPPGKLRIRRRGSAGGHNGLKDIIEECGGEDFPRIKIGVGEPPHEDYDLADWVLSKLAGDDLRLITDAASRAALALETLITRGAEYAMSEYN
jgi:PTH1 family peptidyl-tRNA hydrolase